MIANVLLAKDASLPIECINSISCIIFNYLMGAIPELENRKILVLSRMTCPQISAFNRDSLYEELKDDLINLMKSRYAAFFVQKLVRHGSPEQRVAVFKVGGCLHVKILFSCYLIDMLL